VDHRPGALRGRGEDAVGGRGRPLGTGGPRRGTCLELTKFEAGPDGERPPYYRMAELYFETQADFEQAVGSPEGRAAVADLSNFATGGVTVLIGAVQE